MSRLAAKQPCWCGSGAKFKRCHGDRRLLRRSVVEPGDVSPVRQVPSHIARPDYSPERIANARQTLQIQDDASLERLRHAGQVAAEVLLIAGEAVAPGVTTDEIDAVAHSAYVERGAYPSDLGYHDFPKSICTSVNGVICHGIPDDRPLQDGDIVNIDVTAFVDGMHGDTSATFLVGNVDDATRALVDATRAATLRGIDAVRPGAPLRCIGDAIEPFAWSRGFAVVQEYGGHGIGSAFHGAPHVGHHVDPSATLPLRVGMSFTVEPMLLAGGTGFTTAVDGWTERADDAMPSAQFEHTVVVTETGAEIITVTAGGETAVGWCPTSGQPT